VPDWIVILGLGLLAFALSVGWLAFLARTTETALSPATVLLADAWSGGATILLLIVDVLDLGRLLVSWLAD
jgi:hypothetical protein